MIVLCFAYPAKAEGNRRYKAYPYNGGYLILDTREGHFWVWHDGGGAGFTSDGKNANILYQGKVTKNMMPAERPTTNPPKATEKRIP